MPGRVKAILIIFDSDDDPNNTFKGIIAAMKETKLKYPQPTRLLEIKAGDPAIAIATLPWVTRIGHLDELIFEALQESHVDLMEPLKTYCEGTSHRTGSWSFGKKSKMRLKCLIAASHKPDPTASLKFFLETSDCPVDFNNPCFDTIVDFIKHFRETV